MSTAPANEAPDSLQPPAFVAEPAAGARVGRPFGLPLARVPASKRSLLGWTIAFALLLTLPFVDARYIGEGDRRWFQFWTNGRRRVLRGRPAPGRGVTAGCPWHLGGSPFGFGTLPEPMDVHIIANAAGGTNAPVTEQEPCADQQGE